ncbi:MAG TPA: response regulator transcription factor [Pyrinomonadaceae bacterium]|nr:response regulator transcription factor [Pyrinomonadaceae bacterium]
MFRILLIDDDEELCELVSEYLTVEGFAVESAYDGESGLRKAAAAGDHDLIILDVMLPKKNGFDVLRELRGAKNQIPVLMLTARGDDTERIVGLEIGADDYLAKPFNPRELVARLRAILRRTQNHPEESTAAAAVVAAAEKIRIDDVELSLSARSARRGGEDLNLTSVEFDLLAELLKNAGKVVKKEDLNQKVLGRRLSPFDRSLDMHISNLRKKLGARPGGDDRIRTIRSVGYIYTFII